MLGAECGCEFTAEELQESAELSDEELDGVAGGGRFIKALGLKAIRSGKKGAFNIHEDSNWELLKSDDSLG